MTYWPIASPSVFAATKHTLSERTQVSHDGAPSQEGNLPEHGATPGDSTQSSVADSESQAEGDEGRNNNEQPGRESDDGVLVAHPGRQEQLLDDDVAGEIIATKVTRSGHMFATITQTTLTVWQTKAGLHSIRAIALLTVPSSLPLFLLLCFAQRNP